MENGFGQFYMAKVARALRHIPCGGQTGCHKHRENEKHRGVVGVPTRKTKQRTQNTGKKENAKRN